jgi:hypothetical protein
MTTYKIGLHRIYDPGAVWTFQAIKNHQGPLNSEHPDCKGSLYNALVHWEDGSESYEPLDLMIKDDPVSLAQYAMEELQRTRSNWHVWSIKLNLHPSEETRALSTVLVFKFHELWRKPHQRGGYVENDPEIIIGNNGENNLRIWRRKPE